MKYSSNPPSCGDPVLLKPGRKQAFACLGAREAGTCASGTNRVLHRKSLIGWQSRHPGRLSQPLVRLWVMQTELSSHGATHNGFAPLRMSDQGPPFDPL